MKLPLLMPQVYCYGYLVLCKNAALVSYECFPLLSFPVLPQSIVEQISLSWPTSTTFRYENSTG